MERPKKKPTLHNRERPGKKKKEIQQNVWLTAEGNMQTYGVVMEQAEAAVLDDYSDTNLRRET